MGGAIALDFAIRQPDRVERLVLICPGGVADKNVLVWALPLLLLGPWGAAKVQERIIGTFPPPETEEARQYAALTGLIFRSMVPRTDAAVVHWHTARGAADAGPGSTGRPRCHNGFRVIKQRFEQHVPQAEVLLYPDARHYLGDQSPAMVEFLRRVLWAKLMGDIRLPLPLVRYYQAL